MILKPYYNHPPGNDETSRFQAYSAESWARSLKFITLFILFFLSMKCERKYMAAKFKFRAYIHCTAVKF